MLISNQISTAVETDEIGDLVDKKHAVETNEIGDLVGKKHAVETDEIGDLVGKKRLLDGSVSECKKGYC